MGTSEPAAGAGGHQVPGDRKLDRSRLLLEINNAIVSHLELGPLLKAISGCLRRELPHDFASLAIYDPALNQLRVHALDFSQGGPEGPGGNGGSGEESQATRLELLNELGELAVGRYDSKFREAVASGPLQNQSVGMLMCLIQPADAVVRRLIAAPPPPALFGSDTPGLDLVWVHNLCASRGSDILEPVTILEWMRPKAS